MYFSRIIEVTSDAISAFVIYDEVSSFSDADLLTRFITEILWMLAKVMLKIKTFLTNFYAFTTMILLNEIKQ